MILCLLSGWQELGAQNPERVFRAGASLSNVTPPLGELIVGNWGKPEASHVHDQLYAKSLVLDDGNSRLAIVLVDNVSVDREVFDEAKRRVYEETGLPVENMLMAATHTHSGTSARGVGEHLLGWHFGKPLDEYQTFLASRIADGVRVAMNNLEPAEIAWGSLDVPGHVFVRRWVMKDSVLSPYGTKDIVKMNPGRQHPDLVEPSGPVDPEVSFIALRSKEGKPISILGNYSLHYVGGVPKGDISADYFAVFGNRLGELLQAGYQHPPFVGILSNGTSGNVNNINFAEPAEENAPYEKMRYVAHDLAEKVYQAYRGLSFQDWVPLGASQAELPLEIRRADPLIMSNLSKINARPDSAGPLFHRLEKTYLRRILQMEYEWPDEIDVILQTFRIGDLGIAAIPFETFTQTGLEIKEKSPFEHSFTIELANGGYGYLPTPEEHELGGYETWLSTNRVEEEASVKIVETLLDLFNQLK